MTLTERMERLEAIVVGICSGRSPCSDRAAPRSGRSPSIGAAAPRKLYDIDLKELEIPEKLDENLSVPEDDSDGDSDSSE